MLVTIYTARFKIRQNITHFVGFSEYLLISSLKVKVKLFLRLINKALFQEDIRGSGGTVP
jgi:hypothetical protein